MKIVCISDTHNQHRSLDMPEGDLLLCAGDICFANRGDLIEEEKHIRDYNDWLGELPYSDKVVIAGNHDFTFEVQKDFGRGLITNAVYLDQEMVEINGLKIWGEPRQPEFNNWAFNIERSFMKHVWELVPEDADVLLTHGPPRGFGDLVQENYSKIQSVFQAPKQWVNVGCAHQTLMIEDRIKRGNPFKLVVGGHVHGGYGKAVYPPTQIINASVVNEKYKPVNAPIVIEL